MPIVLPTTNIEHSVVLDNTLSVLTLPAPEFNNSLTQQSTRIYRRTRGGRLRVYRNSDWANFNIYEYSFVAVEEALKDDYIDFVEETGATVFTLTDHMAIELPVVFTENTEITEVHDDSCSYSFGFIVQEVL